MKILFYFFLTVSFEIIEYVFEKILLDYTIQKLIMNLKKKLLTEILHMSIFENMKIYEGERIIYGGATLLISFFTSLSRLFLLAAPYILLSPS